MKTILALIYIRTLIAILERDITPTMAKIASKCTELERKLYRRNKALYLQCTDIARTTWPLVKDGKSEYTIEVEPVICSLYFSVEDDMKKLKFKPTLFHRLYDKYFYTSKCELEHKSRLLTDQIWEVTNKVMMERISV